METIKLDVVAVKNLTTGEERPIAAIAGSTVDITDNIYGGVDLTVDGKIESLVTESELNDVEVKIIKGYSTTQNIIQNARLDRDTGTVIFTGNNYITKDLILVNSGDILTAKGEYNINYTNIIEYDISGVYLKGTSSNGTTDSVTIVASENTKYIKVTFGVNPSGTPRYDGYIYKTAGSQQVKIFESDFGQEVSGLVDKQDKLIAGANIIIGPDGRTISATGGGSSADVTMEDNPDGGINLTVNSDTRVISKQSDIDTINNTLRSMDTLVPTESEASVIQVVEPSDIEIPVVSILPAATSDNYKKFIIVSSAGTDSLYINLKQNNQYTWISLAGSQEEPTTTAKLGMAKLGMAKLGMV